MKNNAPNVMFLNPSVTFHRFTNRISLLNAEGINCSVLAYERNHYPGKPLPIGFISLGTIKHGAYIHRLLKFFHSLKLVRKKLRLVHYIYAFGLDMAILGWIASRCINQTIQIVYEVGDIREIFLGSGLVSKVARRIDRFISNQSKIIVVTSSAFAKEYFIKRLKISSVRMFEIENKLDKSIIPESSISAHRQDNKKLIIGYYGVIRCQRSWAILKEIIQKSNGKITLDVHGVPINIPTFAEDCAKIENINYHGSYVSPDDLQNMYNSIDLVWIVGLHGKDNHLWAKRCRFYEAGLFKKPMIGQIGTMDGKIIEKYGLGPVFDFKDIEEVINGIISIKFQQLDQWIKNINRMPKNSFIYTDEHAELVKLMNNMLY